MLSVFQQGQSLLFKAIPVTLKGFLLFGMLSEVLIPTLPAVLIHMVQSVQNALRRL